MVDLSDHSQLSEGDIQQNADLTSADLRNADLTGATLENSNVIDSNVTESQLKATRGSVSTPDGDSGTDTTVSQQCAACGADLSDSRTSPNRNLTNLIETINW